MDIDETESDVVLLRSFLAGSQMTFEDYAFDHSFEARWLEFSDREKIERREMQIIRPLLRQLAGVTVHSNNTRSRFVHFMSVISNVVVQDGVENEYLTYYVDLPNVNVYDDASQWFTFRLAAVDHVPSGRTYPTLVVIDRPNVLRRVTEHLGNKLFTALKLIALRTGMVILYDGFTNLDAESFDLPAMNLVQVNQERLVFPVWQNRRLALLVERQNQELPVWIEKKADDHFARVTVATFDDSVRFFASLGYEMTRNNINGWDVYSHEPVNPSLAQWYIPRDPYFL